MSDWKTIIKRKAQVIERVLSTPDGAEFMKLLEDTFQTSMFDTDPVKMGYKVGQFELVEYLKSLKEVNPDG